MLSSPVLTSSRVCVFQKIAVAVKLRARWRQTAARAGGGSTSLLSGAWVQGCLARPLSFELVKARHQVCSEAQPLWACSPPTALPAAHAPAPPVPSNLVSASFTHRGGRSV